MLCMHQEPHVQQYCMDRSGSTPPASYASVGTPDQVLAAALDPAPHLREALSHPPWLPRLARFDRRATARFSFTITSSVVSLATVAVSCAMDMRSLSLAIAKFAMVFTLFWRR